ncbi:MAG: 1-acyl-sn-glycerol-3-phosphate acyltransferase [Bacilli bacterium]|nr:1-acyl-sn-glycerol-3-phosphate acyltransferase [Bacilli bacterium]
MSKKKKLPELGYKFFRFTLGHLFNLYYSPKVIGKEKIPKDGPILICGNHKHVYDQCPIIMSTKRVIHYMAKKEYFDGKLAWFFKMAGCIPVNRSIKDENAKSQALDVLKDNGAIGLFPEGTRNKTEQFLLPFKFGAVSMAQKTDATIVPFGLTGDYKFRSKNLTIRFGEPFKIGDMTLEEANNKLYKEIEKLMKQNLKDEKKNRK